MRIMALLALVGATQLTAMAAENNFKNSDQTRITEQNKFDVKEIMAEGHKFFGGASANIASVVENVFSQFGKPSAYIIGEEGSGAFFIGLRYGEGYIYFRDGTRYKIFWQGPSLGFDMGADGSKSMVLVYGVNNPNELIDRFPGVDGSAYIIGGVGVTYQQNGSIILAVIRTGVGARLGVNIGYLKYSAQPDWNPF
ncbi:MAG: DUF1134 domain-containing protein [Rhizobiales bacterium]|nr:DUF1134 domain-containing protein [Hyphomicrobiales bacterium]